MTVSAWKKHRTILVSLLLLSPAACSSPASEHHDERGDATADQEQAAAEAQPAPQADEGDDDGGAALPPDSPLPKKVGREAIVVRTFEQYNRSLSLLTGLPTKNVAAKFETVKNMLPASTDISSFSAFNQIAATNLAFDYCDLYVNRETAVQALAPAEYVDHLIGTFLDRDATESSGLADTRAALLSLMTTTDLVPSGAANKSKLEKVTCAAFLSSSWFVLY
jgi:hypothetical protein